MRVSLPRRAAAEMLGTALLLATVVGSGILADRLDGGNEGVALLANTIATAWRRSARVRSRTSTPSMEMSPLSTS